MGDRNNKQGETGGKSWKSLMSFDKLETRNSKLETEYYLQRTSNSRLQTGVTP
jgi:hypothetical protein